MFIVRTNKKGWYIIMESLNSYMGMARNDYEYAKDGMSTGARLGNYNNVASGCAQSAKKYLKAVLEKGFEEKQEILPLMHNHNLRALYNKVITKYHLSVSSKDCKWLGDFYFDARYPGDYFLEVNRNDAEECLRLVELLQNDVTSIMQQINTERAVKLKELQKSKAF